MVYFKIKSVKRIGLIDKRIPMSLEADGLKAQIVLRGPPDREKDLIEGVIMFISNCSQGCIDSLHTNTVYRIELLDFDLLCAIFLRLLQCDFIKPRLAVLNFLDLSARISEYKGNYDTCRYISLYSYQMSRAVPR